MMLDRFYPIFDDVRWLRRLLPLGIRLVQLRIKDRDPTDIQEQVKTGQTLCRKHDAVLVVNDHWQTAIDQGCNWIHLGQEDLDSADLRPIRRAGIKLGISTHDEAELERALSLDADYIALGPIYPTILKQMKWHEQGLARVTEWKARVGTTPLVAIGGMRVERAAGALKAGADIISAVTDITLNADPETRVGEWIKATR
ncbi:MAG: thiamine phosphate synthase [Rhodobacteraceae bacterium]|nr:thiamine phosphate synthase [Paracoccaceae bacterium]